MENTAIYYKLTCIDQEHAKIAELQIKHSGIDNIKSVMLGRALVVKIDKEGLEQKELSEINYLLSCVRVNAMAYDDNEGLTDYDRDEVNKI
jgi:predicted ATPase